MKTQITPPCKFDTDHVWDAIREKEVSGGGGNPYVIWRKKILVQVCINCGIARVVAE